MVTAIEDAMDDLESARKSGDLAYLHRTRNRLEAVLEEYQRFKTATRCQKFMCDPCGREPGDA